MEHFRITVAGKAYDVVVEKVGNDESNAPIIPTPVSRATPPAQASQPNTPMPALAKIPMSDGDVPSPLAGIVQSIERTAGSPIHEGELVLTLEAMKMYTTINAPTTGTIKAMHVKVGDAVEEGQILYSIA